MNISINVFDPGSVESAITRLEEYASKLASKADLLAKRLAESGYETAQVILAGHVYTGETLGSLTVTGSDGEYCLMAGSEALLFVEFGAGIQGVGHPLAGQFGMGAGTYPGQTHAFDPNGWWYPTSDPALVRRWDKNGQGWAHSYGNPPHMPMYAAEREIKNRIEKFAKEIFSND